MGEKKSGSGLKKRNASFLAFYDLFGDLTGQKIDGRAQNQSGTFLDDPVCVEIPFRNPLVLYCWKYCSFYSAGLPASA